MPSFLRKSYNKLVKKTGRKNDKDKGTVVDSKDPPKQQHQDARQVIAGRRGSESDDEDLVALSPSSTSSFVRIDEDEAMAEQGKTKAQKRRERRMTKYNRDVVNELGYETFAQLRKKKFGNGLLLDLWKTVRLVKK